jgi:hypothetical protein
VVLPAKPLLRAGFATADITPESDRTLVGFGFRDEGSDGVFDPLRARVMALRSGTNFPAILVALDSAGLETKDARKLRHEIAADLETPVARVMVCATHTHSAQKASRHAAEAELRPAIMVAVRQAAGLMFPVRAFVREAPLGMAYNRRVKTADGKIKNCWGPQEWPDRRPGLAVDPTCSVVVFRQENGSRSYILWSFGAHPVVMGKTSRVITGDYPGRACRLIEEYLPGSRALFALAPCGDAHPWVATQEDPAGLQLVARCAAAFVALLSEAGEPISEDVPELFTAEKTVVIGKYELDLAVWRLGGLWIVALPGEIFQEFGVAIRGALGGPVLLVTLANGTSTYWPTKAAFKEGGYEVDTAGDSLKSGDGEKLVEEVIGLADTIRPASPR